jgi:DNA-binding CsgD family transcriptional regulator
VTARQCASVADYRFLLRRLPTGTTAYAAAVKWPLVGRQEPLERIVAAFASRTGGGLVLHGAAGVGKSTLLAEACDRALARGIDVHWVLATLASHAVPFGPFAQLLPPDFDPDQPGGVLTAAAGHLAASDRPVALAVDDAHLLDAGSATLLQHLAQTGSVSFVVTVRDGELAPDAITALWKDLRVPRVRLDHLDRDEVSVALSEALGGDVSSTLVDDLAQLSHGNPLLLRELTMAAQRAGTVKHHEGIWVATGPLVAVDDLPAVVAERLDRLPAAVRAAAELVALAEPVGAAVIEQLVPPEVGARLDDERLLAAIPDRRRVQIRLVHPLYSEALRATVPPLRAREHARRLAQVAGGTGLRRTEDRIRVSLWHLAAGRRDRPDLYLQACRDANAAEDHDLAGRLAQAAVDGGAGLRAELALLRQLPFLGRLDEALTHAEALAVAVVEPAEVVEVALVRARLHVVAGEVARAEQILREVGPAAGTPELRGKLLVQLAALTHEAGDMIRATAAVDEIIVHADEPELLVAVAPFGVRALAVAGRAQDAVAVADRALDAIDEGVIATTPVSDSISMAWCQAIAYTGRFDLALARGQAGAAASRGGLRGAWLRDVGQALLHSGQVKASLAALRQMMAELPMAGISATSAMWALDAMAEACALLGDLDAAQRHLDHLARVRPPGFRAPRTSGEVWTAAASGQLRHARTVARDAANQHARRGAAVPQAQALYDVARLGSAAEVVTELEELAERCQGRLVPALAAAARCLSAGDAAETEAASREFEEQGLVLLAAELATRAAVLHRRQGRTGSAVAAGRRAAELAGRCQGAATPLLAGQGHSSELTEREWEVVTLVTHGLTDREVAERLVVSIRTVHSHLHHAYVKLGVTGRRQLAELFHETSARSDD